MLSQLSESLEQATNYGTCESLAQRHKTALDEMKGIHQPLQPHKPVTKLPHPKTSTNLGARNLGI